jgi:putative spermidine/putrescine transport system ATP-binding protein
MIKQGLLNISSLRKLYDDLVAVDDVSLELGRGEFLTFLGPSGSGKTTVLMSIAGFVQPTSGAIVLSGKPLDPLPPHHRNIGMVFQSYALFPHMTVAQNVAFPLEVRKVSKVEIGKKVQHMLDLVGLPEHGERLPAQLSGGQQQRVALARAMVFEPPLLLMDEPLGALDKKLRAHMQIEIMRLHKELGVSIIYVTHDQEEALIMSDRIAVFNRGRIEQIGTPTQLYDQPRTRFVADFIGESNFVETRVREVRDGVLLCDSRDGAVQALRPERTIVEGAMVALAVRPERLRVLTTATNKAGTNCFTGSISDIVYLGQARKLVVKTASGSELIALQQFGGDQLRVPSIGEQVQVEWSLSDAVVLVE